MTPSISVILPIYNAEKWLGAALDSLASQTIGIAEIIAIDDGSTDNSAAILDRGARSGQPLKILRNSHNLGIVASLNRGLDSAQGRFVARMDADDVSLPHRLITQFAFLEQSGCDLCGSWFIEFGQGIPRTVRWPNAEPALAAAMLFQNSICHPTVLARRHVFEQFRYREAYHLAEDYDLFVRAESRFRIANVPEPLLRYRRHPNQATQAKRDDMERVTQKIRLNALRARGLQPTLEEQRLHNLIRAPSSISQLDDLDGIEAWLLGIYASQEDDEAKRIVASQWIRACIRAAPLGNDMWKRFRSSRLYGASGANASVSADLWVLSRLRLSYGSSAFGALRRFGITA